jgi:long-chain fatty acid transport protein
MNMPGQMLGMMMDPSIPRNQNVGSANGSMVQGLMQAVQGGMMGMPSYARFDFSNSDDFTGEAMGTGFAGKVGMLYKHNEKLKFGLTYHFESQLNDLESDNATVSMNMDVPGLGNTDMAIPGKIPLNDFQWPAMLSAGMSMVFTDRLTAAVDIRRIYWSQVMKDFAMTFTADQNLPGMLANFSGSQMDTTLYQDWDDQNVFAIGAAYKVTPDFTVRAGLSLSDNPIPDARVNYLFPAITQDHYSIGAGYNFAKNHNINFAFIYAPEVKQTNPGLSPLPNDDMLITHSQINWCLGYSYKF